VAHFNDAAVLGNAAHFFSQPGADPYQAERLLQQAAALQPAKGQWTDLLGRLYGSAIVGAAGYPRSDPQTANAAFAEHARTVLVTSADQMLRGAAHAVLSPAALRPELSRQAALANIRNWCRWRN